MVLIKIQGRYLEGLLPSPPVATITGVYSFSVSTVAWWAETEVEG
jgi:hypothetical protein